jgi:hypothetical protein
LAVAARFATLHAGPRLVGHPPSRIPAALDLDVGRVLDPAQDGSVWSRIGLPAPQRGDRYRDDEHPEPSAHPTPLLQGYLVQQAKGSGHTSPEVNKRYYLDRQAVAKAKQRLLDAFESDSEGDAEPETVAAAEQ